MKKTTFRTVKLAKGELYVYDFGSVRLHAYKTNDYIDDEVFIIEKDGKGVAIELPCFFDNINELTAYLDENKITLVAKLVAYHGAGATFMPEVEVIGTKSSNDYSLIGGGAALINNFANVFGKGFDASTAKADRIVADGEIQIAGIRFVIKSNHEAFDIEIPEINCVYTHMLGHDCHSIVAGCPHADGIISQLNYYIRKGFDLVLTSHYTPEDMKDAQTKIDYLYKLKEISEECENADEMREKVKANFADYSGLNYLDMTVAMFFPSK